MIPRNIPAVFPWFNRPAPAPSFEQKLVSSLVPGPRFGPFIGHSHMYRPQPYPGAPAWAYEGLGLAEFSPIGWGVHNRDHLWPLEGPPIYAALGLTTQGLGGLVMGQFVQQGLLTPSDLQSEPLDQPLGPAPEG